MSKDIIFVLDTSGSMADEGKMEKARAALLFGIRGLREGDRFNVINFAGEEHLLEKGVIPASNENKKRGEEFVKKLNPNGGTNINDALKASLNQFDNSDRPKMLVLLTDGKPTVGETDALKIVQNAKNVKVESLRIFPFGVGYDVNTQLLDKLASENSGVSEYVEPKEDLEVKVSNFFSKVSSPVLSDLEMDFGGVNTDLMYPRELTDIFKGSQLVLLGRYTNAADVEDVTLRLTGKSGKENKNFIYKNLNFPARANENDFLPRLWASRRVGWLIEQIRINGENKELKDEVVDLGTRFGLVTPYTSYLATDGTIQNFQTSSDPHGFITQGMTGRRNSRSVPMADSVKDKSGKDAVQLSRRQNAMQANTTVAAESENKKDEDQIFVQNTVTNQFVGVKNFFNQSGNWVDSEIKEDTKLPEQKIKFASDDYFKLIEKEPELGQYLALGENVTVVWKNQIYRITN